jgi:hypothetical protein
MATTTTTHHNHDGSADLNAVLSKLQQQEDEINTLRARLADRDAKLATFTQTKAKEMQSVIDGMNAYLDSLGIGDASLKRFKDSLANAATIGESHPVFDLVCQASEKSSRSAAELEKLRIEHEELKKRLNGGEFGKEDARMTNAGNKRDSSQISTGGDIWDEFEQAMLVQNGMQKV